MSTVGGTTAANVALGAGLANASTDANTFSTIVRRDAAGNFAATNITANLLGNATTATTATTAGSFSGSLAGDVTGTQGATVVSTVGGSTAANINTAEVLANASTNLNTASTIVKRDAGGNFTAGTITAALNGNATTATSSTTAGSATNFTGALLGDVTGNQGATVVSFVGGSTAANVNSATILANAAATLNTASTIVRRNASGDFSAGTITATGFIGPLTGNVTGNATTATSAVSATNFTGALSGDVTGTQGATAVANVGGSTAANVNSATLLANAATALNTINTIVKRDGSGNFAAGTITGALSGNATTATKLATTKNINSVPFDGSSDITVTADANTLTGTTLHSTVVNSSLTNVGTLTGLTVGGATNLNNNSNSITNINTGTSTGAVTIGNSANTISLAGTISGASPLVFEGATLDAFKTTFAITDPTANNIITFPNASGTVALVGGSASWSTLGNAGTTAANFIGTSDAQPLIFKANNVEVGRLETTGYLKMGDATSGTIRATKELIFREDGGNYGTSLLRIKNETGENGAIFETQPTDPTTSLVDFIFKTSLTSSTTIQRNIRLEARASARTGSPSFHIGGATIAGVADPDNPTLSIGDNYSIFKNKR